MLTKKDKDDLIRLFKDVDVKRISIDYDDEAVKKWFKFGSHVGLDIAAEIVKQMPERKRNTKTKVS